MEILESILIISHVVAGVASLIAGLMSAFIGKKGGKLHRQVGRVFYWCMFWIFVSALLIVSFVRFSFFLTIIAVFSYYMAFSGVRALRIKKSKKVAFIDWFAGYLTALVGIGLFGYGIYRLVETASADVLGLLSLFFGFFTAQTAYQNLKVFRKLDQQEKLWWWFAHMNSMGGSLIASITAFLVQNGRIFDLPNNLAWLPWILPAMIGSPLIAFWARKYRQKFGVGKYARAGA